MDDPKRPPDGAMCEQHPDRLAHYVCPRCGTFACLACFHPAVSRCDRCVQRDPTDAAPPLAWERPDAPLLARFLGTLGSAFSPVRTAPAFARGEIAKARSFALLTALPLAALAGVVPFTRTLGFRGDFAVELLGKPSSVEIALDVVQAALLQVGLSAVSFACLLFPFTSLVRAYAPGKQTAAARLLYYRVWLLPAALALYYLVVYVTPIPAELAAAAASGSLDRPPPPLPITLALLVRTIAPVLLFVAMSATARMACGLGPLLSFAVVAVPIVLMMVTDAGLGLAVTQLIPPPLEAGPAPASSSPAP